ncbi:hypothetical protein [Sporosarcina sp. FSL W7-1283]|uniref:hypothetical protein n=1 Tax=Sporosarcina sp. FSL W7-1283 TaxID=2921560 RepID=UPI0030F7795E
MDMVEVYRNATEQLQQVVSQTPQRIKKLQDLIQQTEWEQQDLLHLAELDVFSASQGYDIARQIKKVRLKRRAYKDELEALLELRKVCNNNSKLEAHVSQMDKKLKEDEQKKEKRGYHPRVRSDLQSTFQKIHNKAEVRLK